MNKQLKYMVDCDIIKFTSFSFLMNFCFAVQKKIKFLWNKSQAVVGFNFLRTGSLTPGLTH